MLTFVLLINSLISILCLLVAWQLWNLRQRLAKITIAILAAEQSTYLVLHTAPNAIAKGQLGVHQLNSRYQSLEIQLAQIQQILVLLSFIQRIWLNSSRIPIFKSSKKGFFNK